MKQNLELSNEKLQSDVISFLRFPLIVGVVMIHVSVSTLQCESHIAYNATYYLFAQILARIAVPMFFLFSGFLLFHKCIDYTRHIYLNKLKSRLKTLLIPYLIWNLITIIVSLVFNHEIQFNIEYFVRAFWNLNIETTVGATTASYPICIQFWYIRDLMVLVFLSPIIYWMVKKFNYWCVAVLGVLWIFNWWYHISGLSITGLFFFSLGAFFSIHKKNFIAALKRYALYWTVSYLVLIIPVLYMHEVGWNPLRRITIIVGIVSTLSITARMLDNGRWSVSKKLSESSFFIFACHMLVLLFVRRFVCLILPLNSDSNLVLCYFLTVILTTLAGFVGYKMMKKCLPRITALMTGGR